MAHDSGKARRCASMVNQGLQNAFWTAQIFDCFNAHRLSVYEAWALSVILKRHANQSI